MTMSTYDNAPPLEGWRTEARCCGQLCPWVTCSVCGQYVKPPPNVILGDN